MFLSPIVVEIVCTQEGAYPNFGGISFFLKFVVFIYERRDDYFVCFVNRITGKGKGLHLLDQLTVLVLERQSVLLPTLNHPLHQLIPPVMELLCQVICRM